MNNLKPQKNMDSEKCRGKENTKAKERHADANKFTLKKST